MIPVALSAPDLAVNAIFTVIGACLSTALALWLDVSGTAERIKARRRGQGNNARAVHSNRERRPRAPGRPEWITDLALFALAIRTLIVGFALAISLVWVIPVLDGVHAPALFTVVATLAIYLTGLFLISWTWAGKLSAPLGLRILISLLLPVALFSSAYLKLVTGSEFLDTMGRMLSFVVVALPIASVLARTALVRNLWARPG